MEIVLLNDYIPVLRLTGTAGERSTCTNMLCDLPCYDHLSIWHQGEYSKIPKNKIVPGMPIKFCLYL